MSTRSPEDASAPGAKPAEDRGLEAAFRLLAFAKPYLLLIAVALCFSLVFAGGRYGRAVLTKPLLDEVLLPMTDATSAAPASSFFGLTGAGFSLKDEPTTEAVPAAASAPAGLPATAAQQEVRERALARFRELLAIALLLVLVVPISIFGRSYCLEYVLGRVNIDVKQELAAKLMRLPLSFHRGMSSGDALTRLLLDVDQSQRALRLLFLDFIQAAVMIAIGATALFAISPQLAGITLVAAPGIIGVLWYFARKVRRGARRRQEQLSEVTQRLTGILSGIKVIKAFGGEQMESSAFRRETHKFFRRAMKVVKNRVLSRSLTEMLNNGVGIGVLMLGALLVIYRYWGLTVGDVTAFAATLATTYKPVKTLSRGWPQLMESVSSAERFFSLLDAEEEPADAAGALPLEGVRESIHFDHVHFGYPSQPVLEDIDLQVAAGQVVAIVGPTGSGKTTLADLLLRFHDPDRGAVRIDGVDLRRFARASLLEQIAVVTQEPFLFDATIRENVLYGRPDADDRDFEEATRAAHVDEFVDQLPEGYDTGVGEFGLRLSGGQRQRITIARAVLRNASILIFDEATSALDNKTERTIQHAIESLRGRSTVFVIAHRLSTIRRADCVWVLEHGRVSQTGTHDELISRAGLYRELIALAGDGQDDEDSAAS